MMNDTTLAASAALGWLGRLEAAATAVLREPLPPDPAITAAALAALAAEALARDRSLLVVTPGDELLPEISNALDLGLRPLCLVLPGADYASRIALRATISLLKSRLARDGEDTAGPAWRRQRERIATQGELWENCLAWCARSGDRDSWPAAVAPLFPVRFAPGQVAASLFGGSVDWVVVIDGAHGGAHESWPGAARTLWLQGSATSATAIATVDAQARLRVEFELLGQELAELELELATAQAEIGSFTDRYHIVVGHRMIELDALQAEVAARRAEVEPDDPQRREAADQAQARAARSQEEGRHYADERAGGQRRKEEPPAGEFRASVDVKKLYRQIAQRIHPDRASDEADRAWRTELMAEANRAYRSGDGATLQEILSSWQESMGDGRAAPRSQRDDGRGAHATDRALARQVMRLRRRIAEIEAELNQLYGSRLYELFAAARVARRQGRDLLQEMADRLDSQIADIRAALNAV